jgi:hypothetical protein
MLQLQPDLSIGVMLVAMINAATYGALGLLIGMFRRFQTAAISVTDRL